jgi:predicted acylesterase/phospholipase RssA
MITITTITTSSERPIETAKIAFIEAREERLCSAKFRATKRALLLTKRDIMSGPDVLALPVSGQALSVQAGMLLRLMEGGYAPKTLLGASGGAIIAALALATEWDAAKMRKFLTTPRETDIVKKHMMSYIQAFFDSSFFLRGPGLLNLVADIVNVPWERFTQRELIFCAFNSTKSETELFSTSTSAASILNGQCGPLRLFGVSCSVHFIGDLPAEKRNQTLNIALLATSSVPLVLPPVEWNGSYYLDGGVAFSSPLSPISAILDMPQVMVLAPSNIDLPLDPPQGNLLNDAPTIFGQFSRSTALQDRAFYLNRLGKGLWNQQRDITGMVTADLQPLLSQLQTHSKCLIECYPLTPIDGSTTENLTWEDFYSAWTTSWKSFGYRIFTFT